VHGVRVVQGVLGFVAVVRLACGDYFFVFFFGHGSARGHSSFRIALVG
jgi:hypothetical protein